MRGGLSGRIDAGAINVGIALTALRTNLMRSILTTIGVMIGVFAVTLAVAVGSGAQVSVMESINALGSNMAIVFPQPDAEGGRSSFDRGRLTLRDARAIERSVPGVSAIAPQLRASVQLVVGGRRASTTAIGATSGFGAVAGIDAESGRFLSEADVRSGARVAVLGPTVARKLFAGVDPVGEAFRIDRVPFTVVGVLESKGSSFGNDNDDTILVPITAARARFSNSLPGPDDLHVLYVGFDDGTDLEGAKREMTRLLRERYNVGRRDVQPFTIRTTAEFIEESSQVTAIFQSVLVAIASISLLVGGIGIMNIMLVSVTERTREIGLRMALGAKRRDIRNQFLVEAAILCVIGGAMGILLAFAAAGAFSAYADFPAQVGAGVATGALIFSAAIGILFGGYPALRASRLSPIEALRSE
jgi:putative ABC transport system permease protein